MRATVLGTLSMYKICSEQGKLFNNALVKVEVSLNEQISDGNAFFKPFKVHPRFVQFGFSPEREEENKTDKMNITRFFHILWLHN